jgi:uncharacterized protein (TIGR00369 family)
MRSINAVGEPVSIQPLLDRIPFAAKAGVQCESYAPGRVVLSLALTDSNKNHAGTMHAAALFTVAETAGAAACSTHLRLSGFHLLARGMSIRFRRPANGGVQAHATITEEMADAVEQGVAKKGRADLDVPIVIYNGQGVVVAEMLATYHFRQHERPSGPPE